MTKYVSIVLDKPTEDKLCFIAYLHEGAECLRLGLSEDATCIVAVTGSLEIGDAVKFFTALGVEDIRFKISPGAREALAKYDGAVAKIERAFTSAAIIG